MSQSSPVGGNPKRPVCAYNRQRPASERLRVSILVQVSRQVHAASFFPSNIGVCRRFRCLTGLVLNVWMPVVICPAIERQLFERENMAAAIGCQYIKHRTAQRPGVSPAKRTGNGKWEIEKRGRKPQMNANEHKYLEK